MSLLRMEIDQDVLLDKIVHHVKYDRLRDFVEYLHITKLGYESIITRKSSPNEKAQKASKT